MTHMDPWEIASALQALHNIAEALGIIAKYACGLFFAVLFFGGFYYGKK